jgi:ribonucleoside-diphosphate reductase beta chain
MTTASETVRRVEESDLEGLRDMDIEDVYAHIDILLKDLPGPLDLYQRWERQQWSASALDFTTDATHWRAFGPFMQEQLQNILCGFFVGEQAVTDTLSPILIGAPDEESRWFLSTQVVDEARHAYFFARFFNEVIGIEGGLQASLDHARRWSNTPAYRGIFDAGGELVLSTEAVRLDPHDYGKWVRAVTVYHLMVEGILALTGQRLLLQLLRRLDLLPAFRAGFTAVTRDESRHVNYGIWALRRAVEKGHEGDIRGAVERSLEASLRIYANPHRRIVIPANMDPRARQDPRDNWTFAIDSMAKRLRAAHVDTGYVDDVSARGWAIIWNAVAEYERIHGEDHPVREWERGALAAAAAPPADAS